MRRLGLMRLLGVLLAGLLLISPQAPALALPGWMDRGNQKETLQRSGPPSSGRLQEVAPPGAVQEIRRRLSSRRPQLQLISPKANSINNASTLQLTLSIEDWPLSRDPELGIGPHVVLQVDDREPIRLIDQSNGRLHLQLDDLSPGSHRFSAWAAYPWGEAVKTSGASIQWQLHQWQQLAGTQPDEDDPWLVPSPPVDAQNRQPLLLDWLLWNAPLQNLRDGDARWRLRITLDGDSFLVDHLDALWLNSGGGRDGSTLQMELLDGRGEPLQPVFNNRLIRLDPAQGARPSWMKERISEDELLRLSGEPISAEPDPEPTEPATVEAKPIEPETDSTPDATPDATPANQAPESEMPEAVAPPPEEATAGTEQTPAEPEEVSDPEPEAESVPELESDQAITLTPVKEKPVLRPESSLGGSARDLLDANGRLRQP